MCVVQIATCVLKLSVAAGIFITFPGSQLKRYAVSSQGNHSSRCLLLDICLVIYDAGNVRIFIIIKLNRHQRYHQHIKKFFAESRL